ncbi:MAG TPA: class I SAM-dependent methyltransferase [Solirubrobacteraceae bacterium]
MTELAPRLNLGCGTDIRRGYVNLDIAPLPGVDVVHDLGELPLPFPDAAFDEVNCKDILEHLDYVDVLREIHRILRPGGRVVVEGPHFTAPAVWIDPTHRTAFSIETLGFFVAGGDRAYYFDFHFSAVADRRIVFHRYRWQPWNYVVEPLVNLSSGAQRYYEETFLARLFPAANVRVTLVK